jgi:hypothetical protein
MRPADRITPLALSHRGAADSSLRPAQAMNGAAAAGRALVVIANTPEAERLRPRAVDRSRASFVAHLAATKQGLPQTCSRRRAAPDEAVAAYAATTQNRAGAAAKLARVA